MKLDLQLFMGMLGIDSTSGKEREMALWLAEHLKTPFNTVESFEVGDGTLNLLFSWGTPKAFLCTHMDTVPPYISPEIAGDIIRGRGSCDAKGQIFSMFTACRCLEEEGLDGFGLLLLSGEETGSFGAKAYTRDGRGGDILIVGEPTDNHMVSASKGTKAFSVTIKGKACHSGYPELGSSAIDKFIVFMERLRSLSFPEDPVLGKTTWNIGGLVSDNPQNILSPEVKFRLYFRTTFASDDIVAEKVMSIAGPEDTGGKPSAASSDLLTAEDIEIIWHGGDTPMRYFTFEGIPTKTVAFGSDAPRLDGFARRALCGPGSIFTAHTSGEHIRISDIETAVSQYVSIVKGLLS